MHSKTILVSCGRTITLERASALFSSMDADVRALLQNGHIGGAAIDVFEVEPLPQESPLWSMDNVYVYPHSSWTSEPMLARRLGLMYTNLEKLKKGEALINVVDISRGY